MSHSVRHLPRIAGLETEYGCLTDPPSEGFRAIQMVRDWTFENNRYGLIDRHHRDWDEAPGNGGFLFSGGRLYLDMGHVEYCTGECATVADLVRQDRAGDHLLLHAVKDLGLADRVQFIRNNIDHRTGATFGCHENYSLSRRAPLNANNIISLLTFLTLRTVFSGSGRVGSSASPLTPFQISQRADHIQNDFYEWVQHNRAIINTRDEPLADPRRFRRLHLLHGDTNVLPAALYLKIGCTRLVLDLLEEDRLPRIELADAVVTLRELSQQPAGPWRVQLANGKQGDALAILGQYRHQVQRTLGGRDPETDAILALWLRVETGLLKDRSSLIGLVDWVTKMHALELFRESENLEWNDPWLESQDLEYHHIDPRRSLGLALANNDGPWAPQEDESLFAPPTGTRAELRSRLMREIVAKREPYELDWDAVRVGSERFSLSDPLQTQVSAWT